MASYENISMTQSISSTKNSFTSNISAISCKNIHLKLGGKVILDDISLQIYQGQVTTLLGPNGAGKSSLLKILADEIKATANKSSEIYYFNESKADWSRAKLAKHVGVLPQQSSLTFAFTVREVVEMGLLPLSLSRAQADKVVNEMLDKVDILHLDRRLYPLLSGGEKQRVHFARVLAQLSKSGDKTVLMLDEPTSALDLSHQHNTLSIARKMADQGATVIIVLHDLNLAAQYSDRVLILNEGKIQADGSPWQALTAEKIGQVYQHKVQVSKHPSANYPVVYTI
jgi:iron complex transport system ATP-binding protein